MKRAALAIVTAFTIATAVAPAARAATCRDIQFPDSIKVANADLVLNGLGIRKATLLRVKVYVAALYVPHRTGDAAAILRRLRACKSASPGSTPKWSTSSPVRPSPSPAIPRRASRSM